MKTGMSVLIDDKLYTVIVPGDINASGTVNTADMRLLQRVLVGGDGTDRHSRACRRLKWRLLVLPWE